MIFSGGNKLHIQNWMPYVERPVADLRAHGEFMNTPHDFFFK